jgi:hypothetical protein
LLDAHCRKETFGLALGFVEDLVESPKERISATAPGLLRDGRPAALERLDCACVVVFPGHKRRMPAAASG